MPLLDRFSRLWAPPPMPESHALAMHLARYAVRWRITYDGWFAAEPGPALPHGMRTRHHSWGETTRRVLLALNDPRVLRAGIYYDPD
jgi:hypothetical protein